MDQAKVVPRSWKNLRGSQAIQLNAGLSLMQSYGSDVGGFMGEYPTPELFVRWVQLGVTHSRFSIHSSDKTPSGQTKLNTPWMVGISVSLDAELIVSLSSLRFCQR